ncbi:MAG: hypothetical protein K8R69_02795 [Deltaproteobacteria bacterium]|nr:hypothetical protein [Deltaproteobacteria bacterium]
MSATLRTKCWAILRSLLFLGFLGCFSHSLGCGAASPPIGIPAPVSNLMIVSPPDENGTVAVLGEPGAVLRDAVVSSANITQGGSVRLWEPFLYGVAQAQSSQIDRTVVAASDGSFRMRLFGKPGDVIRVVQTLAGEKSPGTDLIVPAP